MFFLKICLLTLYVQLNKYLSGANNGEVLCYATGVVERRDVFIILFRNSIYISSILYTSLYLILYTSLYSILYTSSIYLNIKAEFTS